MNDTDQIADWMALDRRKLLATILSTDALSPGAFSTTVAEHLTFDQDEQSIELTSNHLRSRSGLEQAFAIGTWLSHRIKIGDDAWRFLASHPNALVREWAAILIGLTQDITFARKLAWIKPFADDADFGLREIAWRALRADVVRNPSSAIHCLVPWTGSRNERLRRFAAEITRPCGVGCSPIPALQDQPELGLAILEPLSVDDTMYVQEAVADWLQDASRSKPDWVQTTIDRWLRESGSPHIHSIAHRVSCSR